MILRVGLGSGVRRPRHAVLPIAGGNRGEDGSLVYKPLSENDLPDPAEAEFRFPSPVKVGTGAGTLSQPGGGRSNDGFPARSQR